VQIIVRPVSANSLIHWTTFRAEYESRPDVGSSTKSKFGFVISSQANANLYYIFIEE